MLNLSLRDKLSQMKLPVADERHAQTIFQRILIAADTHTRKARRRLNPVMSDGDRSYEQWLEYLRKVHGEAIFFEQDMPSLDGSSTKEHLFMALDCNPGHEQVPMTLILIDSANPEDYDTLVCARMEEAVFNSVVAMYHHSTLEPVIETLAPYLVELGYAFSEDELPRKEHFLALGHDGYLTCEMDLKKSVPTITDWIPRARWTPEQASILSVATDRVEEAGGVVILASDYFNQVAQQVS